jgi:hypothetical protein
MATNSNDKTTIGAKELKILQSKAKAGWRCYYVMRDELDDMSMYISSVRNKNRELIKSIKDGNDCDVAFLKKQFVELYDKVSEKTECPVCMEQLTKDNLEVPNCGHLICKVCKDKVMQHDKKCPCCRKQMY